MQKEQENKTDIHIELLVSFLERMRMAVPRKTVVKYMTQNMNFETDETADRWVRDIIAKARKAGYPIVPMQGGGYCIAETREEASPFIRSMRSRAIKEFQTADGMERYFTLKEQGKGLFEGVQEV